MLDTARMRDKRFEPYPGRKERDGDEEEATAEHEVESDDVRAELPGQLIWIEEMFADAPKWSWVAGAETVDEGRARTKLAAMRAAERVVDKEMKERAADAKRKGRAQ